VTVPGILQALEPVVQAFEALGVSYHIGGSIASSAHGIARATLDIDLVADLADHHVGQLLQRLQDAYYIDEDAVRDAVRRRSSFNIIHFESMLKLDVFVLKPQPYSQVSFARARMQAIDETDSSSRFFVASPEDVILHKLDWFLQGGGVSERQWNDVLGVIKVQRSSLDYEYLMRWAEELGLSGTLFRALEDAGESRLL
jgi:hypothetical protein